MTSKKKQDDTATVVSLTNADLKNVLIELGADIVDTLDSIHNALVNQRKEIKRLHDIVDNLECNKANKAASKPIEPEDVQTDSYQHYIN